MQRYSSLVPELDFQHNLLSRHKISSSYGGLNGDNFSFSKSPLLPISFVVCLSLSLALGTWQTRLGRLGTSAYWGSLLPVGKLEILTEPVTTSPLHESHNSVSPNSNARNITKPFRHTDLLKCSDVVNKQPIWEHLCFNSYLQNWTITAQSLCSSEQLPPSEVCC